MFYVYKLYLENSLVYIGSTNDLTSRLRQHACQKKFDEVYISKFKDKLVCLEVEQYLISKYKPVYNSHTSWKSIKQFSEDTLKWEDYEYPCDYSLQSYSDEPLDITIPGWLARANAIQDNTTGQRIQMNLSAKAIYSVILQKNGEAIAQSKFCIDLCVSIGTVKSTIKTLTSFGVLKALPLKFPIEGAKNKLFVTDLSDSTKYTLL